MVPHGDSDLKLREIVYSQHKSLLILRLAEVLGAYCEIYCSAIEMPYDKYGYGPDA